MNENGEVELKLETDPASIALLGHMPLLAAAEAVEHEQVSTYFDTPEQLLRKSGLSLRVREIGTMWIQTVKAESKVTAGLFARPEWEMPIDGDKPVIDAPSTPLLSLTPTLKQDDLAVVFQVFVTRQKRLVVQDGAQIELVFDQGEIRAGRRTAPVCEVELELKTGAFTALFALARALNVVAPVQLSTLSKSQRGYALLERGDDGPAKSQSIPLSRSMSSSEGFQVIAHACIHQFRLNQSLFVKTDNPEALHQVRIALRRLRSALSIFRPMLADDHLDRMRVELRWISRELDAARDVDVLLAHVQNDAARGQLGVAHAEAYATAKLALGSSRLRTLMLDFIEWLTIGNWLIAPADNRLVNRPLEELAADVLDRCRRHVKQQGRHWGHLDDRARHKLRIKVKKLRYASDFFSSLFPASKAPHRRKAFLEALEALQAYLGDLNDQTMGTALLSKLDIVDAVRNRADRKAMLEGAAEAYGALIDAKRFWR